MSDIIQPKSNWKPKLFGKQWDVFNTRKRVVLVSGSRLAAKTWACLHRVVRHMWETPGARVGIFTITRTSAEDLGSWQDLIERTIPEWVEADIGLGFMSRNSSGKPGAYSNSTTRTAGFELSNRFTAKLGSDHPWGTSECRLISLANEDEIARLVKGKSFSMCYFLELSNFKSSDVLTYTKSALRLQHLKPKNPNEKDQFHMWLGDTNPDEKLGDQSWFYKKFYLDRNRQEWETPAETALMHDYFSDVDVIEMFMHENPFATEQEKLNLIVDCKGNQALHDSHVLGKHGAGDRESRYHFADIFSEELHVIGNQSGETDQIDVNKMTTTLYTGFDVGQVFHAAGILDMWYPNPDANTLPCFSVLDECVVLDERIRLEDFTLSFIDKMRDIDKKHGKKFTWQHYIDDAALTMKSPSAENTDALTIMNASEGLIDEFFGVKKPAGSIPARVRLVKKLLRENRLFVSKRCHHIIDMFKKLEKGELASQFVIRNQFKHSFDWLSYVLFVLCFEEVVFSQQSRRPSATPTMEPVSL